MTSPATAAQIAYITQLRIDAPPVEATPVAATLDAGLRQTLIEQQARALKTPEWRAAYRTADYDTQDQMDEDLLAEVEAQFDATQAQARQTYQWALTADLDGLTKAEASQIIGALK